MVAVHLLCPVSYRLIDFLAVQVSAQFCIGHCRHAQAPHCGKLPASLTGKIAAGRTFKSNGPYSAYHGLMYIELERKRLGFAFSLKSNNTDRTKNIKNLLPVRRGQENRKIHFQ